MEKIKIEDIEAAVERKKIRNIYIAVNSSTGAVEVSAPLKAPFHVIETFFKSKLAWIRRHKAKISQRPPKLKNKYAEGEKIELFGKKYTLKIFDSLKTPKVFLNFDTIDLYIGAGSDFEQKREAVDKFYGLQLAQVVPDFALRWSQKLDIEVEQNSLKFLFKKVQKTFRGFDADIEAEKVLLKNPIKLEYKRMKSRWGSCNISDKKITINTELAKKSLRCVEYVTAHELLHLKERNHNKRFKDYMKNAFPDFKKLETELKSID